MPIVRDVNPRNGSLGPRVPKYAPGGSWQGIDYGLQPVYLFAADVTDPQHSTLIANADVTAFPSNLDNTLGANRQAVEDALEGHDLPGQWVTVGLTYRALWRVLVGIAQIANSFDAIRAGAGEDRALFPAGVTLNTQYNAMPVAFRDRLVEAVDALGYDRSSLTGASTMRDLLRTIGGQATPITFLGVSV